MLRSRRATAAANRLRSRVFQASFWVVAVRNGLGCEGSLRLREFYLQDARMASCRCYSQISRGQLRDYF